MNPQDTDQGSPQQQVIERLRTAVNVLVTVSNSPTVDQLAAAIGFTLTLNKLGKHATAVFSGDVPSTLEFLKPEATIEKNTDSLRDFIVSLDKSKADKLRYKVEENIVKIFITPYRTSLTEKDLNFSQGDFNVDAVVALGVTEREQLDQAIISHGRILHDATVITLSAGSNVTTLGVINWQDPSASSLCEMLVGVGDALQPGSLDNQIATAYLTGIVSQTERFRNEKTTPKIMSMSAQLMAAGANQQLIASSLEQVTEVPLNSAPIAPEENVDEPPAPQNSADGSLTIEHEDLPEVATAETPAEPEASEPETPEEVDGHHIAIDEHGNMAKVSPDENGMTGKRLVVQPLSEYDKKQENSFSGGPHPFTANMSADGEDEPSTDPLSIPNTQNNGMMLDHNSSQPISTLPPIEQPPLPPVEPVPPAYVKQPPVAVAEPTVVPMPLPTPQINPTAVPFPPALDNTTIRELEKTFDSRHIAQDPHSTLDEIEHVFDSPHLKEQAPVENLDSARGAVENAIQATPYDANRPDPLQALNATQVDLPLGNSALTPPTTNDPFLAGLGLTDAVQPPSPFILPPLPPADQQPPAPNNFGQSPPPVPPPMMPMQ